MFPQLRLAAAPGAGGGHPSAPALSHQGQALALGRALWLDAIVRRPHNDMNGGPVCTGQSHHLRWGVSPKHVATNRSCLTAFVPKAHSGSDAGDCSNWSDSCSLPQGELVARTVGQHPPHHPIISAAHGITSRQGFPWIQSRHLSGLLTYTLEKTPLILGQR